MATQAQLADLDVELALGIYRAEHGYIQEAIDRLRGKGPRATLDEVRRITARYLKGRSLTEDFLVMRHED